MLVVSLNLHTGEVNGAVVTLDLLTTAGSMEDLASGRYEIIHTIVTMHLSNLIVKHGQIDR